MFNLRPMKKSCTNIPTGIFRIGQAATSEKMNSLSFNVNNIVKFTFQLIEKQGFDSVTVRRLLLLTEKKLNIINNQLGLHAILILIFHLLTTT